MKNVIYTLFIMAAMLVSCADGDYTDAIPANCTAIISFNAQSASKEGSPFSNIVSTFSDSENAKEPCIDITKDIYLFETSDGTLGMCAALNDADELSELIKRKGIADNFAERNGCTFCTVNNRWIAGWNGNTMIVTGPVIAQERSSTVRRMSAWLAQEEDKSIKHSPLWEHLQEEHSEIRLIAQASAMPEQVVPAFTIGAPKGTDADDVIVEAELSFSNGTLYMKGKSCSYNMNIKQSLNKATQIYRPLTIDWEKETDSSTFAAIFMNVDGNKFMPYLQNNKALNTMLMGTDAYDKIRDNKEELVILISPKHNSNNDNGFTAEVKNLPNGTTKSHERLVVMINIESFRNLTGEGLAPLLGDIKRIVYTLKD